MELTVTKVEIAPLKEKICLSDTISSFGSCFSTEIGNILKEEGYRISNNPFGVLFNPASISASILRLLEEREFSYEDVIDRDPLYGSGAARKFAKGKISSPPEHIATGYASFYHHSSFAASTPEAFLEKANLSLHENAALLRESSWILVTFGTAWVFRHLEKDIIVSNCHKRPAYEFRREMLSVEEIYNMFAPLLERTRNAGSMVPKRWIFTVSPIRHLKDTLHGNQLSKATLLMAVDRLCRDFPENAFYFPAYEIVLDELRDYRYFAEDMVHSSAETVRYVWERFKEYSLTKTTIK